MSRSYPVITLWLLENPFDIITLWQLQEGKCSISSPTSTLFWEPRHRFSALPDLPNVYKGSVWGASRNQCSWGQSGVESFQSKLWIQESHSQGTGNGLIITSTQRGKLLKYKRIWFYLKDHWNISLFSVNDITFPFTKETLGTHIMLNILICQFVGH